MGAFTEFAAITPSVGSADISPAMGRLARITPYQYTSGTYISGGTGWRM